MADGNVAICEQKLRDVWSRNESVRAEIGQILHTDTHTDTHTHAAKLVVEMTFINFISKFSNDLINNIGSSQIVTFDIYRFYPNIIVMTFINSIGSSLFSNDLYK